MIQPLSKLRVLAAVGVSALVLTATAAAGNDTYKQRLNDDDMAAARAAVVTKNDIGNPGDWTGGYQAPAIGTDVFCADHRPKYSDLVITGAGAAIYKQPGISIRSVTTVLQSAKMVQLHAQREYLAASFISCARASTKRTLPPGTRLVSLKRLAAPRLGAASAGWRTIFDVDTGNGVYRMAVDSMVVTRGRTEIGVVTTMPLSIAPTLYPNELVVMRSLYSRARV